MNPGTLEVFLSYAHEDAAAARRISDALRGFNIVVWHDQTDVRGGEEWEKEVRKQIQECVLFIPIVSQTTQKRLDGAFRHEWTLAAERARELPAGTPFLVPVVVDTTPQAGAVVPEEFLQVPWTRMETGTPNPEFVKHVQGLLDGPADEPDSVVNALAASVRRQSHKPVWALVLLTTILVGGVAFWKTSFHHTHGTATTPVVLLMDSAYPDHVYDPARLKVGGTNADDITDLLHDLPVTTVREATNAAWHRETEMLKKIPALIVINSAAFDTNPSGKDGDIPALTEDKLVGFLGYVATVNPDTRFLVYSRHAWDGEGSSSKWRAEALVRFPVLTGRIDTWRVPLDRATFRDPRTGQEFKASIERALGFKSGSASQD